MALGVLVAVAVVGAVALGGGLASQTGGPGNSGNAPGNAADAPGHAMVADALEPDPVQYRLLINWDGSGYDPDRTIEIDSFSWGEVHSTAPHSGGGGGAGTVTMSDLVVVKEMDSSSAMLMKACASGASISEVKFESFKANEDGSETTYFIFKLEPVIVSSYQTTGSSDSESLPTEQVSFYYNKIEYHYFAQEDTGGEGDLDFGWDLEKNEEA